MWQVPLETLKSELDKHLAYLKNRLVEVINDDYNDFVSLSTKLVNVDGAVMRMKKPLLELRVRKELPLSGLLDRLCIACILLIAIIHCAGEAGGGSVFVAGGA